MCAQFVLARSISVVSLALSLIVFCALDSGRIEAARSAARRFQGRPLTRNGAPGHPTERQNEFKMVSRGFKIVTLCVSSACFAWFLLLWVSLDSFPVFFQLFYLLLFLLSFSLYVYCLLGPGRIESRAKRGPKILFALSCFYFS